ncbi:hypothetical protein [Microvirgula curvata]
MLDVTAPIRPSTFFPSELNAEFNRLKNFLENKQALLRAMAVVLQ